MPRFYVGFKMHPSCGCRRINFRLEIHGPCSSFSRMSIWNVRLFSNVLTKFKVVLLYLMLYSMLILTEVLVPGEKILIGLSVIKSWLHGTNSGLRVHLKIKLILGYANRWHSLMENIMYFSIFKFCVRPVHPLRCE